MKETLLKKFPSKFLFLHILYINIKIAMLTQLDPTRFNLAIQTGRRFYVACSLLMKYSLFFIDVNYSLSFNRASFRYPQQYEHMLHVNFDEEPFNPLYRMNCIDHD